MRKWVVNGCAYYEDVTDINVGSIEEAIKQLKDLKRDRLSFIIGDEEHDKIYLKDIQAIETVLGNLEVLCDMQRSANRELKNAKQINEEHKKINGELREKVKELEDKYILEKVAKEEAKELLEDSIPKQKIKKLMKERLINLCGIDFISIQQLEFLLQESEDK